jgi:hypothetical protein
MKTWEGQNHVDKTVSKVYWYRGHVKFAQMLFGVQYKFSRYSSIFKYIILFDLLNRENLLSNLFCVHVRRSLINKL